MDIRASLLSLALLIGSPAFGAPNPEPPSWSGTIVRTGDRVQLVTDDGAFALATHGLTVMDKWAAETVAFEGMPVTVRGWKDETGKALFVEEFSPGTSADFVHGRVEVAPDGAVVVRVRDDKRVSVENPILREKLRRFQDTGVILPGAATYEGGRWRYRSNPPEYYLLTRITKWIRDEPPQPAWRYSAETPHEWMFLVGAGDWRSTTGNRIFVRGRIPDPSENLGPIPDGQPNNRRFVASWASKVIPTTVQDAVNAPSGLNVARNTDTRPVAGGGRTSGAVGAGTPR